MTQVMFNELFGAPLNNVSRAAEMPFMSEMTKFIVYAGIGLVVGLCLYHLLMKMKDQNRTADLFRIIK